MSTDIKPIKVYGKLGPNPPKVTMILEELGIPHEIINIGFAELKQPDFLAVNPNGRMPAIHDPNTDLTLWETGAIIEYLIERYDTERKLSFAPGSHEAYHAKQWLFFQVSGQGPYYGQAVWFTVYHHEKLPSAVERYVKEIKRVNGVLEGHLKKQKEEYRNGEGPWLVGGKLSYADLAFISWQFMVTERIQLDKNIFDPEEFPEVVGWVKRMRERPAIEKVVEAQLKATG